MLILFGATLFRRLLEDENYTYEILQEKHLEEPGRFLANVFNKFNPFEISLKSSSKQRYT